MPSQHNFPAHIQRAVRERAGYLCEYCHTAEAWQYVRFTIDHVIPQSRGGTDELDNLALACFHCNRRKFNHENAFDPTSNSYVPLFNPRHHHWFEHFIWSADQLTIVGITPTGRATLELLQLNRQRVLDIRAADLMVGRHPPSSDPIARPSQEK